MESWTEFVIARYNYWVVIVLMMIGLYTVFARGNLVKKIVGLNIFQTSVFIFYITMGKIAGGTAPIYIGGELDHGDGHGGHGGDSGHGADDAHGAGEAHDTASHDTGAHDTGAHDAGAHGEEAGASLHAKIENDLGANALKAAANDAKPGDGAIAGAGGHDAGSLHNAPDAAAKITNDQLLGAGKPASENIEIVTDAAHGAVEAAAYHSEVLYTNPLPHVLILTAIVVGVAGTAVGLALAIRIREAYGTIEEDELEAMDNVAEFGDAAPDAGARA